MTVKPIIFSSNLNLRIVNHESIVQEMTLKVCFHNEYNKSLKEY